MGLVTRLEMEAVSFCGTFEIDISCYLINSFLYVFKFLNSVLANELVCHKSA